MKMSSDYTPSRPTDRDRDRRSDLAVMSQSEYLQKRRLERILDAHDRVEDIDTESLWPLVNGELTQAGKEIILLKSVQSFVRELLNPLKSYAEETDGHDRYWRGDPDDPIGVIEFEFGEPELFTGLRDFVYAERFYTRSREVTHKPRNRPERTEVRQDRRPVPEHVSLAAYERLKEFAARERGLELSFSADDHKSEEPGL